MAVEVADADTFQPNIEITIKANVNLMPALAQKLVNVKLVWHVGNMLWAGPPRVVVEGEQVFYDLPIFVRTPNHDPVPIDYTVRVDAVKGDILFSQEDISALRAKSSPILRQLYPEAQSYFEEVERIRTERGWRD